MYDTGGVDIKTGTISECGDYYEFQIVIEFDIGVRVEDVSIPIEELIGKGPKQIEKIIDKEARTVFLESIQYSYEADTKALHKALKGRKPAEGLPNG